ncbi:MAG TPA: hypothetical protein VF743_05750, partial [Acidimicrobiales bacterium]
LHGRADRFCPPAAALALHDALPAPGFLDLVPGMGHGFRPEVLPSLDRALAWILRSATPAAVTATGGP